MKVRVENIDWNASWKAAKAGSTSRRRDSKSWNRRAPSFAKRQTHKSNYADQFISILKPKPDWHVLDVGCGPGTLAIPLAKCVASVTALDFSETMLDILKKRCKAEGVTNVTPVLARWEDDWDTLKIRAHDVAIASRSLNDGDLQKTIDKLNQYSKKQTCITFLVGDGPFDRSIFEAVGRPFHPRPDYIYFINLLHQMGIYANLSFTVHTDNRTYADHEDALEASNWMLEPMTAKETERLKTWFKDKLIFKNGNWVLQGKRSVRWAVMWWEKSRIITT